MTFKLEFDRAPALIIVADGETNIVYENGVKQDNIKEITTSPINAFNVAEYTTKRYALGKEASRLQEK